MGVHEGRGQLAKALKELMSRWRDTRVSWNDGVSEKFEKEHLLPIEADLKAAVSAMDHMSVLMNQIRRDCE